MKHTAKYTAIAYRLPRFLREHILCFETDAVLEAAFDSGSTVMIEARRR
jgi:hypothetical protein